MIDENKKIYKGSEMNRSKWRRASKWRRRGRQGEKIFSPSREHACARAQEEGSGETSREVEEEERKTGEENFLSLTGACMCTCTGRREWGNK